MIRDIGYTTPERASTATAARSDRDRAAVARHLAGRHRGRGAPQGAGRRRPGHDVRLRLRRDEGVHAASPSTPRTASASGSPRRGESGELPFLLPDGKCQVTVEYSDGKPVRVEHRRRVDAAHAPTSRTRRSKEAIIEEVVKKVVPPEFLDKNTVYYINPTGPLRRRRPAGRLRAHRPQDHRRHLRRLRPPRRRRLQRQGPEQGRPQRRLHGALRRQEHRRGRAGARGARCRSPTPSASPSRSRCWSTRSAPATCPTTKIAKLVREVFDLKPAAIIETLGLKRPIYQRTASYGHFGRVARRAVLHWATDRVKDCVRPGTNRPPSTRCRARRASRGLMRGNKGACPHEQRRLRRQRAKTDRPGLQGEGPRARRARPQGDPPRRAGDARPDGAARAATAATQAARRRARSWARCT